MMTKDQKICSGVSSWKPGVLTTAIGLFLGLNMATAQVANIVPPKHSPLDKNGVNLATGQFQKSLPVSLSLGNPEFSGIAIADQWYGSGGGGIPLTNSATHFLDGNYWNGAFFIGYTAVYNGRQYAFDTLGGSLRADGASLSADWDNGVFTMTTSDGTVVQYKWSADLSAPTYIGNAVATQVAEPNGRVTRFVYKSGGSGQDSHRFWLVSAANNLGYQIRVIDTVQNPGPNQWYRIDALKGINGSVEYCDRLALTCAGLWNTWPTVNYAYQIGANNLITRVTVTDATGAITSYSLPLPPYLTGMRTPGSGVDNISIGYNIGNGGNGYVNSYSYSDGLSNYSYFYAFDDVTSADGSFITMYGTITGPGGYRRTTIGDRESGFLLSDQDVLGRTTTYTQDDYHRVTKIVRPEGNSENWTYDDRGNITEYRAKAKAGSGLADIVVTAGYDATCANPKTCNKPNWVRDANGNQTDFTYAPEHGGVLTEIRPAVTNDLGQLVRPVTRYAYTQRYAWLKNSMGGYSAAESPVWVKTEERTCRTSATVGNACAAGTADEIVTAYDYGPNSGPNNLLLRAVAVTASGQTRRTCFAYDAYGNKISETKPLANCLSSSSL